MDKKIVYVVSDAWTKNNDILGVFDDKNKIINFLIDRECYIDGASGTMFEFIIDDFWNYADKNNLIVPENYDETQEWIETAENFDTFLTFLKEKLEKNLYYVDDYDYNICSFYLNETN